MIESKRFFIFIHNEKRDLNLAGERCFHRLDCDDYLGGLGGPTRHLGGLCYPQRELTSLKRSPMSASKQSVTSLPAGIWPADHFPALEKRLCAEAQLTTHELMLRAGMAAFTRIRENWPDARY